MKRAIYTSVLLLTNLLLLVHTIIPHHYHDGRVILVQSHSHYSCQGELRPSHCHTDDLEHQHPADKKSENCSLNALYTRMNPVQKISAPSHHNPQGDLYALPAHLTGSLVEPDVWMAAHLYPPYFNALHPICHSLSIGLRAPPIC